MFTVIIPCYNNAAQLNRTVAGLASQVDAPPFEVILVDNNSDRDDIEAVHRRWVETIDIFLVKQPRLASTFSVCRARNIGLRLSQYPWLVSLDSDCIPNPHYLSTMRTAAARQPDGIFTGERIFIDATGVDADEIVKGDLDLDSLPLVKSASNYYQEHDRRLPYLARLNESPHPWSYFHGGNKVYPKEQAIRTGGHSIEYDGHWGYEDIEFAHRMISLGRCVPRFVSGIEVYHQEPDVPCRRPERFDKRQNPNWELICRAIPGYREHKELEYQRFCEVRV